MKLSRSCWRGFVVILFAAIMGMSGCGGGGSSSAGPGDTTPTDGEGGVGGDATVLTIASAAESMKVVPAALVMQLMGFEVNVGSEVALSSTMNKALSWPSVCSKDMDQIISCDSIAGGGTGTLRVQGYCDTTTPLHEHMGLIADLAVTFDDCVYDNAVLSGQMTMRMIMGAYLKDWDNSTLEIKQRSIADDPVIMQAVSGDGDAVQLDWMYYSGRLDNGLMDLTVEKAILLVGGVQIPGVRNTSGGVDWGSPDLDPALLQQLLDRVLAPENYCYDDGLVCDPDDVDGEGVHEYCSTYYSPDGSCDDGCCEFYALGELTDERERECGQLVGNNFSEVYLATYSYTNDEGVLMNVLFEVPILCINSFWSFPCADNTDCVKGVCDTNSPELGSTRWSDFKDYYDGYGFCVIWYYDFAANNESMCAEGNCCSDGLDNDGDCLIDCADLDCVGSLECGKGPTPESGDQCADGIDNDFDFLIDCAETDCNAALNCEGNSEEGVLHCIDGVDNDLDGLMDCDEPSCRQYLAIDEFKTWCGFGEDDCTNSIDDDGDGDTDCDDSECLGTQACPGPATETICDDGINNDYDGWTDCQDEDCMGGPDCVVEICFDVFDNDGDGLYDGKDPDCATHPACTHDETDCAVPPCCDNGLDDDRDFLIDCVPGLEDPDCNCS